MKKGEHDVFPPGFEPGTFRVLGERDNHYTTETETAPFSLAVSVKTVGLGHRGPDHRLFQYTED